MTVFLASCAYTYNRCQYSSNISSTLLILAAFKLLECSLYPYIRPMGNYILYPTWLALDLAVMFLLMFKVPLLRKLNPQADKNSYFVTRADMLLGGIYFLYLIISILALIEHILRHLDDFGASEGANYVLYLHENARYVYHAFPYIKHLLNILEFIVVWSTLTNYMRSGRVLHG